MIQTNSKTCGGKLISSIILPKAIKENMLPSFALLGFKIKERFFKQGILAMENDEFAINGVVGNRSISIYCNGKLSDNECKSKVEVLLKSIHKIVG